LICAQVAPSGECLRGYTFNFLLFSAAVQFCKGRYTNTSLWLWLIVIISLVCVWQLLACAEPRCYTWPVCWYLLCCSAW